MRWFRLYDDLIDDPKILRLPIGSRWFYICLLCVSSKQNDRGALPDLEEIAIHLRVRRAKAKEIIDEFKATGLIDEDPDTKGLRIHNWHNRQFKSDDVTARVETFRRQHGNVSETPRAIARTRKTESESDTETESDTEENQKEKLPKRKTQSTLPDWIPSEDWAAYVAMRRSIGKPMTDRAVQLAVSKLADLRAAGHAPAVVLQQSIFNSWQGLFAIKADFAPAKPKEEPLKYHVEPEDSPHKQHEREVRAKLRAIFTGGEPGPAAAAQSRG